MKALRRALSAEALKIRGTLALWMCLIAPATVVTLYVLQLTFVSYDTRPPMAAADAWKAFAGGALALWILLMQPLFVTLEAALLAGLEHGNHQWKHLLALPLPRGVHYLAKLLALTGMVALAIIALCLLIALGGWVLGYLQPNFGIGGAPPWAFLLPRMAQGFLAALLMVALQIWVSIRWRSFTVAVSFGMVATVAGYLIGQSARFAHWYPWTMPMQVLTAENGHLDFVLIASTLGFVVVAGLALWDFIRRDVA